MWKTKCKAGNRVRGDLLCRPCHMYHATRYFTSNVSNFVHLVLFAGVIERNPELFKPKLPKEKTSSMQKMVFGTVNKIFIAYEKPFLHPDITEVRVKYLEISWSFYSPRAPHYTPQQFPPKVITLWNPVDEKVVPMAERWYRKIYSFCKGCNVLFSL